MASPSCIYRRPSGVYVVRLVVPARLRGVIGKTEIHQSTGTRLLPMAKLIASGALAHWREKFLRLDGMTTIDLEKTAAGSPLLSLGGYGLLNEAASLSGIPEAVLLRYAAEGRLGVFLRLGGALGHLAHAGELERDPEGFLANFGDGRNYTRGPMWAEHGHAPSVLKVMEDREVAGAVLASGNCSVRVLRTVGAGNVFVPDEAVEVTAQTLALDFAEVEVLRQLLALATTTEQVALFKEAKAAPAPTKAKPRKLLSDGIAGFLRDREAGGISEAYKLEIRTACESFMGAVGDFAVADYDRSVLRGYVENVLPNLPAPSALRAKGASLDLSKLPRISASAQKDRVAHVSSLFRWLCNEGWIAEDPSRGLKELAGGGKSAVEKIQTLPYTTEQLQTVFSEQWWNTGHGKKNKHGRYHAFSPYYYWVPLIGLYTGARINEICQLRLKDVRQLPSGIWVFDILTEDDEGLKVKGGSKGPSVRMIPVHPHLIDLGLIQWRDKLEASGYDRLFPELRLDPGKGYGKDATEWYGRFMEGLGFERNRTLTFHSFRHTFSTYCASTLGASPDLISGITGHSRGESVLMSTYVHDHMPEQRYELIKKVKFELPDIASFDVSEGLKALEDAKRRKRT